MAGRFIKLYEQILDWEWYHDINTFRLFIHLLLKANYKDSEFKGMTIHRGQLVTSLRSLAANTSLSIRQVRDSLEHLILTGEVTNKSYTKYRVITINRYDDYQSSDKQNDKQMTNNTADKRQTNDKQNGNAYRNIEYKNYRNIEKENSPSESKRKDEDDLFDQFWSAYPRKTGKQDAMKAWKSLKVDAALAADIMTGLSAWKGSDQWNRDDGKYIPYPARWLRGRRWEDEVPSRPVYSSSKRVIPANDFEQRDYSSVDQEIMDNLAAEMEEFLRGGGMDG